MEYDYRGLQRVYRKTENFEKLAEYERLLDEWLLHRAENIVPEYMRFLIDSDVEYHEPIPPEGTTLEQLAEDFYATFESKLGGPIEPKNWGLSEAASRSMLSSPGGEASRSTGL